MPSPRYQISLRSILTTVSCLSVGLVASVEPPHLVTTSPFSNSPGWLWIAFEISLATVACALGLGLVKQLRVLRDFTEHKEFDENIPSSAVRWAVRWRIVLVVLLIGCLAFRIAVTQGLMTHPYESNDSFYMGINCPVVPDALLYLGIFAAFNLNDLQARRSPSWKHNRLLQLLWVGASIALAIVALCNMNLITYLVYIAIAGIEHAQPARFYRPGAYAMIEADGDRFVWLAAIGFGSLFMGLAFWFMALERQRRTAYRVILMLTGTIGLAISTSYSYWHFTQGFPTLAPEFKTGGLQSDWWNWMEAAVVVAIAIPFVAYKASQQSNSIAPKGQLQLTFLIGTRTLIFGALGSLCGVINLFDIYFLNTYRSASLIENLKTFATDLSVYLPVAIFLCYLGLLWRVFITKQGLPTPRVPTIDPQRFAITCLVLAIIVPLAIPTLAATSFAFWLSPWNS